MKQICDHELRSMLPLAREYQSSMPAAAAASHELTININHTRAKGRTVKTPTAKAFNKSGNEVILVEDRQSPCSLSLIMIRQRRRKNNLDTREGEIHANLPRKAMRWQGWQRAVASSGAKKQLFTRFENSEKMIQEHDFLLCLIVLSFCNS